jgi:hypothetical protein
MYGEQMNQMRKTWCLPGAEDWESELLKVLKMMRK